MKSLGEVLKLSTTFLQERRVERPRRMAEELMAQVLKLKRMELYLQFDRPLMEEELALLREWLKRQAKGEPLAYIIGEVEFLDCSLEVDRRVLIPRPETEILVAQVIQRLKGGSLEGKCLWDLCTGSGCIGIALKKALPSLEVTLLDVSKEALELADANAKRNGVEVSICQGDLLNALEGRKADFLICNPPYISKKEFASLDPSVRDFEPSLALLGGEEGLDFYVRLERDLPRFLQPGALFFFEIGYDQGQKIKEIFNKPIWQQLQVEKDWAGHPRFFSGSYEGSLREVFP